MPSARFTKPVWEGQDLTGKTLLLHCEQGLGSTLQWIRFAPLIAQRGGKIIVECQFPLKPLLASSYNNIRVVAQGRENPGEFDYHLPLMSVPRLMKYTPQTLPANIPYLFPIPDLVQKWKTEFPKPAFHIGVAWQGNPKYKGDSTRSIPLRHFEALSKIPGVRLHSLQKINGLEQFTALDAGRWMNNLTPRLDDQTGPYLDTAAVISHLDLVITTDTSIAHLAGAMGKEVWVGLCSLADWRWLHRKSDTPWYPKTLKMFRQTKPGEWETVFEQIMAELKTRVNA